VIEDLVPGGRRCADGDAGASARRAGRRRAVRRGAEKPLPFLPEVIGVVTSPSGAVIRDILHRLRDRFPRHVLIWPVAVQGAACAPEVANAPSEGFNALPESVPIPRPDVLIVARGGGSLEDLWGFNEEAVVRAAAESVIPLISAVGHETDTTLIDHASDRRAPTPTAAAEMAVPVRLDLLNWVRQQDGYMTRAARQGVATRRSGWATCRAVCHGPKCLLDAPRQRLDRAVLQLGPALRQAAQVRRRRLDQLSARLEPALERAVAQAAAGPWGVSAGQLRPSDPAQPRRGGAGPLGRPRASGRPRLGDGPCAAEGPACRWSGCIRPGLRGHAATGLRGRACRRSCRDQVAEAEGASRLEIEFADGKLAVAPTDRPRPPGAEDARPLRTPRRTRARCSERQRV
jgi:exodeoxyribonuclease VII large subunit